MKNSVWRAVNVPFPAEKELFPLKTDALRLLTKIRVLAADCAVKAVLPDVLH